jgi:HAD superfamily hydrolase (TIGR01509 family)
VLWDLDGTLADSRVRHWESWQGALAAEHVVITPEQFLATFGQTNESIIPRWLGERATPEVIQRIADAKESGYRRLLEQHGLQPLPGAAEWVARLHTAGWRQAIASSAPRLNVDTMLRALQLEPFFDTVASAEDVTAGKPDPEVFLVAARKLAVPPDRCVVVEDAAAGIEAARRAGMKCIGVGDGATRAADLRVHSLAELPADAFQRLLGAR